MLQQTQVARVLIKYPEFLRRFPTLQSLARAGKRDVVVAWQGMGYNNRAVRLHQLANVVEQSHGGRLPRSHDALLALPGIGRYTANALLASAFGMNTPVVDVNVRRFLSRLLWRMHTTGETKDEAEIWTVAERILPTGRAYDWNQALMDMGALVCTARSPQCSICPVARFCRSRTAMGNGSNHQPRRKAVPGIPNRIYRGRIIDVLREAHVDGTRSGVRADLLGKRIRPGFSTRNAVWLKGLLNGLVKDGLIRSRGNGALRTRRVMLA